MKKLAIITNSHVGNDSRLYHKIALSLKTNFDVKIFCFKAKNIDAEVIKVLPKAGKLKKLLSLYKSAKKFKPDVVICVEPITILVGIALKKRLKCKLVYDCHEFFAEAFAEKFSKHQKLAYNFYRIAENMLIRQTNSVICVNSLLQKRLKQASDEVYIAGNNPIYKNINHNATKEYDLIYSGGISKNKGALLLLNAVAKINNPKLKVAFAGSFLNHEFEKVFFNTIKKLQLENNIVFLGQLTQSELYFNLAKAKIGICLHNPATNRYKKAIPLKLLEYMQCGLPVITNKFSIIRPILAKYNAGKLIDYDVNALASAINKLLTSNLDEYSKQAQLAVSKQYNWKTQEANLFKAVKPSAKMLLVAYFYPPLGGAGVQRPLKMVKHFKNMGLTTDVLTVKDIYFHSYDYSLLAEDESNKIVKAHSFDPMAILQLYKKLKSNKNNKKVKDSAKNIYFKTPEKIKDIFRSLFLIDEKIGWLPLALYKAIKLTKKENYDYIMATIGPYTSALIAYLAAIITQKPLIIDYRDHWTLYPYREYFSKFHFKVSEFFEKKIINKASLISVVSPTMKQDLEKTFNAKNVHVMYNGYDEKDFEGLDLIKPKPLQISYIGNFYGYRTPDFFLKALLELKNEQKLPEGLKVNFVGNYYQKALELLKKPELESIINIIPQQEHKKALEIMLKSSALLLFIGTPKGKGILTGKVFEYLRSKRHILAMVPTNGDAEQLLKNQGYNYICPMEDYKAVKANLEELIKNLNTKPTVNDYSKFSRENQSKLMLEQIKKCVK